MDKDQYWKNRKAAKRGQGPKPSMVVRHWLPSEWQIEKRRLANLMFREVSELELKV